MWVGRLDIVRMSFLPHLIYRFSAIPVNPPACYFMDINEGTPKCTCRGKKLRMATQSWRLTPPDFEAERKATGIKTAGHRQDRRMHQWDKTTGQKPAPLEKRANAGEGAGPASAHPPLVGAQRGASPGRRFGDFLQNSHHTIQQARSLRLTQTS